MPPTHHHPLLLVRHAETALNAAGQIRGHLDPALDSAGERQAFELAATVSACQPLRIVSSPLRRATATAAPLSELTGRPVEIDQRLIDRDYGQWAGHQRSEVEAEWGTVDRAPGVEPAENLSTRMLDILDEQRVHLLEGPVVLVSHDATNSALLAAVAPSLGHRYAIAQDTACWNMLHHNRDTGWVIDHVNQRSDTPLRLNP